MDPKSKEYQDALASYGAVAVLAQQVPELNTKLQLALKNGWDAARFEREIWTTSWYKTHSDNTRALRIMQATDPGGYKAKIAEAANSIQVAGANMGKTLSRKDAEYLAGQQLWFNWDTATLQAYMGEHYKNAQTNGRDTGLAGDTENHVITQLNAYGIPINKQSVQQTVNSIVAGKQTTGGFDNQLIGQAKKLHPMFAQDFDEGRTLADVAKPYIQQAANTLEIDPSAITLNDKNIQQALTGDGKAPMPLWAFQQALKKDPRWQHTDNAKNSAYDTIAQIGKDWGFM